MRKREQAIGVDVGTGSGRAALVEVSHGKELATTVYQRIKAETRLRSHA